jgi:hypothetical protein
MLHEYHVFELLPLDTGAHMCFITTYVLLHAELARSLVQLDPLVLPRRIMLCCYILT